MQPGFLESNGEKPGSNNPIPRTVTTLQRNEKRDLHILALPGASWS